MEQVFLSLGSNLGNPIANLQQAIRLMREFATVLAISHAYETEPVEYTAQPWFTNAVLALKVQNDAFPEDEAPIRLLEKLMTIERQMGRIRGSANIPKGPRLIDLDIILYANRVIATPSLTVPHPAMHLRRFVLEPLVEIAPTVEHPILHMSALQMLEALPADSPQVQRGRSLAENVA